jgi:hypothetical protein
MPDARAAGANGSTLLVAILQMQQAAPHAPAAGRSFQLTTDHFQMESVQMPVFSLRPVRPCHATVIFAA